MSYMHLDHKFINKRKIDNIYCEQSTVLIQAIKVLVASYAIINTIIVAYRTICSYYLL